MKKMDKKVMLTKKEAVYICNRGDMGLSIETSMSRIVTQRFVDQLKKYEMVK